MPQIASRTQHETALAAALLAIHEQAFKDIGGQAALFGESPKADDLPAAFWDGLKSKYAAAAKPLLSAIYLDAVAQLGIDLDTEIDLQSEADGWAAEYSNALAASLVTNRKQWLIDTIARGKDQNWTVEQLLEHLLSYFNASNADTIAITESTSAVSAGGRGFADAYKLLLGTALIPVIRNDFDPCDVCIGKQGKNPLDVGFSPFHTRCRCYEDWGVR